MKRNWMLGIAMLTLLALSGLQAGSHNAYLLPEERGTAGALAALEKLPVYIRLLQTTAHPDDESAGALTWLSRKFHAQTALFCLTRGEGGQNILGNEKYEALGLVRTGELLEACRYYGVELFFSSSLDFGFSKTAEETLSKWGHDAALEEMVHFIRWWRPAIILSRFQGDSADGHGHHQAAGILTREAFRAAGDPQKFPEQLQSAGLQPWQAKQLYVSSRPWAEGAPGAETNQVLRVPVGDYDPVLGRSYREIGSEGYSKHRTQGNGTSFSPPGRTFENFRLVDSVVENRQGGGTFSGAIDTSLTAILQLAGNETSPFLKEDLEAVQKAADAALGAFQVLHPERSAAAVAGGAGILERCIRKVEASSLSKPAKGAVLSALEDKLRDFQKAASAVLGIYLVARTEETTAVPGEQAPVNLSVYNQGPDTIAIQRVALRARSDKGSFSLPADCLEGKQLQGGGTAACRLSYEIPPDAGVTEPFWYLKNTADTRYSLLSTPDAFAPFGPPEIAAEVRYTYQGNEIPVFAAATAQAGDPVRGADFVDFQIVPAISVTMSPEILIAPIRASVQTRELQVTVLNNRKSGTEGVLKILPPEGWQAKPRESAFKIARKGSVFTAKFTLEVPPGLKPGRYTVGAAATVDGRQYSRGYQTISYPENWTRNLYAPARSGVEVLDIRVPSKLSVGYVPGAGDDVPAALEQLGVKTQTLTAADLAFGDLGRFSAIVTGIRAYNVNEDLRTNNQRLLDYVAAGGTLIVQYVRPTGRAAGGDAGPNFLFGPYPMNVSDADRITVENSPVRILDSTNPVFNRPNAITADDFQGWVQERGLYFMNSWDAHYTPLLSGNDPGEAPRNGGMLYARHGKGHYIYTGYAWFRQLPAGNRGALRIFANMISLGNPQR